MRTRILEIDKVVIRRFGGKYDGIGPSGWHVVKRRKGGEWESLSGPHFSYLKALSAAREKGHIL